MRINPSTYPENAFCSDYLITLPEPIAARAESVSHQEILRWLRETVQAGESGYAIVSGNRLTAILLYASGQPIAIARTRGPTFTAAENVIDDLQNSGTSDFFAMTFPLPVAETMALSGLFNRPSSIEMLDDPGQQFKLMLANQLGETFSGAIVLQGEDALWAVLLLDAGEIIGCYGSDNAVLRKSSVDASVLFYFDELQISIFPIFIDPSLLSLLSLTALPAKAECSSQLDVNTTESVIELLSRLENGIEKARQDKFNAAEKLTTALANCYDELGQLPYYVPEQATESMLSNQLIATHWNVDVGILDTSKLLKTLQLAAIHGAWLAGANALLRMLTLQTASIRAWLPAGDDADSSCLTEVMQETLAQASALIRSLSYEDTGTEDQENRGVSLRGETSSIYLIGKLAEAGNVSG